MHTLEVIVPQLGASVWGSRQTPSTLAGLPLMGALAGPRLQEVPEDDAQGQILFRVDLPDFDLGNLLGSHWPGVHPV